MAGFFEALGEAVKAATCQSVANFPNWASNLREAVLPEEVKTFFDTFNCTLCGNCDESDYPDPPFQGGQCPVFYNLQGKDGGGLNVFGNPVPPSDWFNTGRSVLGPIVAIDVKQIAKVMEPDYFRWSVSVTGAGGITATYFYGDSFTGFRAVQGRVVRADGLPDNCGDPPVVLPPPGPISVDIDVTFDEGDNTNITVPLTLVFGVAYVAIDGSVEVPITVQGPLVSLEGTVSLFPDFTVNVGPTGTQKPGVPDDKDPSEGHPPFDAPDDDLGPGAAIIGLLVRSTPTGGDRNTLIPHQTGPDVLAPGIATVRFRIRTGSVSGWTADQRVKGVNEFVPVPWPAGADNFSVAWEPGWTGQATAIRGKAEV